MLSTRQAYSQGRLADLQGRIAGTTTMLTGHPLSVYVTGSYGRLEAWAGSDIDVFFLHAAERDDETFPFTAFIRLSAVLIDAAEAMGFPPFTAGGRYLEIQYVGEMERVLGSPEDDSLNSFTARMLLLLESRPLLNEDVYEELLARIVGFYFRDYPDNSASFLPTFLLNDILRFWRTLTLNYEHDRLKLMPLVGAELDRRKAKSALKNYKLKISRLATCFSMAAHLSSAPAPITPEQVIKLCHATPAERFEDLRGREAGADALLDQIAEQYAAFLDATQKDEGDLEAWLSSREARGKARADAERFGNAVYELLRSLSPDDRLRYLVL
jgi:hypothetical protein